jgi:hypothetical protein
MPAANLVSDTMHKRIISPVKIVSLLVIGYLLRSRWCLIIVLNALAPVDNKTDDAKCSFNKFPK